MLGKGNGRGVAHEQHRASERRPQSQPDQPEQNWPNSDVGMCPDCLKKRQQGDATPSVHDEQTSHCLNHHFVTPLRVCRFGRGFLYSHSVLCWSAVGSIIRSLSGKPATTLLIFPKAFGHVLKNALQFPPEPFNSGSLIRRNS